MNEKIKFFVDGSSDYENSNAAGGVVIYHEDTGEIETFHVSVPDKYKKFNNVAGELFATVFAIQYAIKNGYKIIDIYYDYYGIEKWATREWRAKNELTLNYSSFITKVNKYIQINFHKVQAHMKKIDRNWENEMNELADKTAKEALKKQEELL